MAGVYWIGQNGNTYVRSEGLKGVQDYGNLGGRLPAPYAPGALTLIRDPALPPEASPAPTGGGGAARPGLDQVSVNNTQLAIDQLPAQMAAAMGTESQRYRNTMADFDAQEAGQRKTFDQSTTTNQQNYDSTFMDSIRAGIKGLGGLMNILRGTGASGGTVEGDVRDIVGEVTAKDIRTGADTQKENQTALNTSLEGFLGELGRKRRVNDDTFENNKRAIQRDSETQMQDLFSKMAGFYGEAGRTAEADTWKGRAGSLTPSIARNSMTALSNYDNTPVVVKAPELTAFAAPTQPDAIAAPSDGQVGSGIFTMTDRRRREPALAGV
ncbi:MAG TPA: hypothetical protein VD907_06945 [Verrucomicrobiae bacterium]|nr:hypothetical protein [Verrucomicrobiae bacterium]